MIVEIKRLFRSIGFRFDAMAAFLMCQHHGVDLNELDKIPSKELSPSWVWAAHRSYCIEKNKRSLSYEKITKIISRMRKDEWDRITEAMLATRAPDGDDKKKVQPGTISSSQDGQPEYVRTIS